MQRDNKPIIVSAKRIERAAKRLQESDSLKFFPLWYLDDRPRPGPAWVDGRENPIQHVERVIRALNGLR